MSFSPHSQLDWVIGLPLFTSGEQNPAKSFQVILPYFPPPETQIASLLRASQRRVV